MKSAAFEYVRPKSLADAIGLLAQASGAAQQEAQAKDAQLMAGGQSLVAMMNLRVATPDLLIDIGRLDELQTVSEDADHVSLGACVTHAAIEDGKVEDPTNGMLASVAAGIAYRAVRNRGTVGGSLAHADPAAELPLVAQVLDAGLVLRSESGTRTLPAAAFFAGSDSRNYYRGDRATARFAHAINGNGIIVTPYVGANLERDWSTGSLAPTKSPWSFFGRKGNLKMRRPNPRVDIGSITSGLGGITTEVVRGGVEGKLDAMLEQSIRVALKPDCSGFAGPICPQAQSTDNFTQLTLDGQVGFPTFGSQTFAFKGHAVVSWSGTQVPAQRFAYLGGSGTLATVDLLALGGDHLLFVQGDYIIPFDRIQLPLVGPPFLGLRYAAGSAGVGGLPTLIQNLGVGVGASLFRVDYTIDPAQNRSPFSRKSAFSFGVSLAL